MSYLFGDSTPSTLEIDYIQFLRDAFDCCVDILRADERIAQGKIHLESLEKAAAVDLEKVEKVAALVPQAFGGAPFGPGAPIGQPESPAARCAAAILRSAAALAAATVADVKGSVEAAASKGASEAAEERRACAAALERLLIKHDLPGMKAELQVVFVGAGHYVGRSQISTEFGVSGTLELEVPRDHLFERVVRLDRLADKLDVQAPELGGWLHKEIKLRPQHLEKHHVVGLSIGAGGDTIRLRAGADGSGPGFDVTFEAAAGGAVRLLRVDDQNKREGEPFTVESNTDVAKLQMMREKLVAAAMVLTRHRRGLVDVKIDGEPLANHPTASLLAERLVAAMAPTVQEIASRSQSRRELVLRRLIGEARREEIFLAKQELVSKLDGLSAPNRALFDPLWIVPSPGAVPLVAPRAAAMTSSESSSAPVLPAPVLPSPVAAGAAAAPPAPPPVPESFDPFPTGGIIEIADSGAVTVIGLPSSPAASPPSSSAASSERTNPSTSDVVEISLIEEAPTTP